MIIWKWRKDYNKIRPHSALGYILPLILRRVPSFHSLRSIKLGDKSMKKLLTIKTVQKWDAVIYNNKTAITVILDYL